MEPALFLTDTLFPMAFVAYYSFGSAALVENVIVERHRISRMLKHHLLPRKF